MGPFFVLGAPGAIRTPDRLVRSQVLYPTELQAPWEGGIIQITAKFPKKSMEIKWRRERDSNPRWSYKLHTPLAGERLRPARPSLQS